MVLCTFVFTKNIRRCLNFDSLISSFVTIKRSERIREMADELNADEMCSIFNLPDCVLSILLSYMDATTLYQLSLTCQYFKSVIESPRLWKYIDARREPNINDKVHYCTERIHEKTTHVFFRARDRYTGWIPHNFFEIVNPFKHLKVLALENQRFNAAKFSLRDFPTSLEELSLKRTQMRCADFFFQQTDKHMRNLRVLILDGCKWVTCSFLVSVAKYENLEIISAVKCIRLHMDMIPYLSFTRFGCRKLKVFDCRLTGIGHELLHSFCPREAIQSLYFQGMKSSEYDYSIKAFKSAYMRKIKYPSVSVTDSTMFDESLYEYIDFISSDTIQPPPESVLYKDPYPKCTCGYKKQEGKSGAPFPEITEDYYFCEPPRRQLMKFVCSRHVKDVQKLPNDFKEFFISNQTQFYVDVNSENESESDSDSGTESDTSCCMYGMGRKMILLTPGDNRELRQEVLQLGQDDQRERPNVNIFIASPLVESRAPNSEPDRAVPSTSRGVPENGTNENVENTRNETKRKHEGDDDDSPENKKAKVAGQDDLGQLSDEAQEAVVNQLVGSAADVRNRLNRFLQNSLEEMRNRPVGRYVGHPYLNRPSTSRDRNANERVRVQGQGNVCVIFSPKSDSSKQNSNRTEEAQPEGNNSSQQEGNREPPRVNQDMLRPVLGRNNPFIPRHQFFRRNQNIVRPILIQGNRELSRLINPLYLTLQNKFEKKKLALRRLSLRGFRRITNRALDYIKHLNLELLDLTYTSVTEDAIEAFLISNPNCRIVHPAYCVCTPINPLE